VSPIPIAAAGRGDMTAIIPGRARRGSLAAATYPQGVRMPPRPRRRTSACCPTPCTRRSYTCRSRSAS
jgi:hypothetical protein